MVSSSPPPLSFHTHRSAHLCSPSSFLLAVQRFNLGRRRNQARLRVPARRRGGRSSLAREQQRISFLLSCLPFDDHLPSFSPPLPFPFSLSSPPARALPSDLTFFQNLAPSTVQLQTHVLPSPLPFPLTFPPPSRMPASLSVPRLFTLVPLLFTLLFALVLAPASALANDVVSRGYHRRHSSVAGRRAQILISESMDLHFHTQNHKRSSTPRRCKVRPGLSTLVPVPSSTSTTPTQITSSSAWIEPPVTPTTQAPPPPVSPHRIFTSSFPPERGKRRSRQADGPWARLFLIRRRRSRLPLLLPLLLQTGTGSLVSPGRMERQINRGCGNRRLRELGEFLSSTTRRVFFSRFFELLLHRISSSSMLLFSTSASVSSLGR